MRPGDPSEREAVSRLAPIVIIGFAISLLALAIVIIRAL